MRGETKSPGLTEEDIAAANERIASQHAVLIASSSSAFTLPLPSSKAASSKPLKLPTHRSLESSKLGRNAWFAIARQYCEYEVAKRTRRKRQRRRSRSRNQRLRRAETRGARQKLSSDVVLLVKHQWPIGATQRGVHLGSRRRETAFRPETRSDEPHRQPRACRSRTTAAGAQSHEAQ